jgi:hypothetical protein
MLTDDFLYQRLRELTRRYAVTYPNPVYLSFGEPTAPDFYEFELEVLESGDDNQGTFWKVLTSVMCQRQKGEIGSVYQPLCCSSVVWASGKVVHGGIGNSAISEAYVAF